MYLSSKQLALSTHSRDITQIQEFLMDVAECQRI